MSETRDSWVEVVGGRLYRFVERPLTYAEIGVLSDGDESEMVAAGGSDAPVSWGETVVDRFDLGPVGGGDCAD